MYFIGGLLIFFSAFLFSVLHLQQSLLNYMDPVGFAVVILGTIAVGFMIMPWNLANEIKTTLKAIIKSKNIDMRLFTTDCFKFIESVHAGNPKVESSQDVYGNQILKDGLELLQLGFNTQKTAEILEERILQWNERKNKVSNSIRSLAKYPPAFGLVGTVLGLVSLMRAISEGASSTEAGFRMAVALVATLYGLLMANLIVNPAGETAAKLTHIEKKSAELALQAVILAADRVTLLEAQEVLNSHVSPEDRVNILNNFQTNESEEAGAAA